MTKVFLTDSDEEAIVDFVKGHVELYHPPAPGDPVVDYSFFPGQLSSAVRFDHPGQQGKGIITQQEVV